MSEDNSKLVPFERVSDLTAEQRQEWHEAAVKLRLSGNGRTPYKKIAEILEVSPFQAKSLVQEGFKALSAEEPEDLREKRGNQIARLETLLSSHWKRAQSDDVAWENTLRTIGMINQLLGLDAPQRLHVRGEVHHTGNTRADIDRILDAIESRENDTSISEVVDAEIVEE